MIRTNNTGALIMRTAIWAHRGASAKAPENTMEAFRLAHEMKADGIELDVGLTRDGELVVTHDETIDRCSDGSGRIIDMTLAQLREYDFSCGMPGFSDVRIPTLKEVLEWLKDTDLLLNIDIKSGCAMYAGIEAKLVVLVHTMGLQDRVIYSSFNPFSLILVRKLDPQAKIGLITIGALVDCSLLKADAIHPYLFGLT
jgi:glycerophosphoryl diester phosphodiesterase